MHSFLDTCASSLQVTLIDYYKSSHQKEENIKETKAKLFNSCTITAISGVVFCGFKVVDNFSSIGAIALSLFARAVINHSFGNDKPEASYQLNGVVILYKTEDFVN